MSSAVNVLLVGLGRISGKHIEAIESNPRLRLWGVCDHDQTKLAALKDSRVRKFSSFDEALKYKEEIGLVSILTYSKHHPEHASLFLKAGIPTLIEKPLALSVVEAESAVHESNKAQVPAFVDKQTRLNAAVKSTLDALRDGSFGELVLVSSRVFWCRPESYYREGQWRMRRELDGGVIWNQASHYIDLMQMIIGEVKTVSAIGRNFLSPADSFDTVFAHLEGSSGVIGSIEATTTIRPSNFEGSLTISGTSGLVKIGGHALNKIEHWGLPKEAGSYFSESEQSDTSDVYGSSHAGVYASVLHHLDGFGESEFLASRAIHTVEIMQAIDASIERGLSVRTRGDLVES